MSYAAAHKAIRERFDDQWASATPVQYPNVKFSEPNNTPWVRLTISDASSEWAGMGDPGNNPQRNYGQVTAQIFIPATTGEGLALEYADQIKAIYRSWEDATSGVRFMVPPYARRIGDDGSWYQINVIAPFQFDDFA